MKRCRLARHIYYFARDAGDALAERFSAQLRTFANRPWYNCHVLTDYKTVTIAAASSQPRQLLESRQANGANLFVERGGPITKCVCSAQPDCANMEYVPSVTDSTRVRPADRLQYVRPGVRN